MNIRFLKLLTLLACLFFIACQPRVFVKTFSFGQHRHLQAAEENLRLKQYDEAISDYRKHVNFRLRAKDKPSWENPYFYYLIIGDIELRKGDVIKGLDAYEFAELHKVEGKLVSDRYRFVASWYESHGKLKEALKILEKYRDRDPLLFDTMSDRIAKDLVTHEELSASSDPK